MVLRPLGLAFALLAVGACRSPSPPPRPIGSVLVQPFRCADPVTAEAVRNVVIGTLASHTSARIVRDGAAEVVVEGTVTTGSGAVGTGSMLGSPQVVGGAFRGAAGQYVTGVTALVLRDGEILASASWGQALTGEALEPPEHVAAEAAERLLSVLRDHGLPK
jgi:hypothetical protein